MNECRVRVQATQVDNPDRYALAALEVSRGARGAARRVRFLRREYAARVREDTAPGLALLALHTAPAQSPLQFYVSDKSFLDKFAINSAGEVLLRRALDYETAQHYHYQVMNDTAAVNISVIDVNEWEPRFRFPHYEFRVDVDAAAHQDHLDFTSSGIRSVEEDAAEAGDVAGYVRVGRLDVHDGDGADTVTISLRGPDAELLYVREGGELFLRRSALAALNSSVLHVVATAVDSGSPPRQTSVPVSVHVAGGGALGAGGGERSARAGVLGGFAAALALLLLLVLVLLAYICHARRRRSKKAVESVVALPPEKPASAGNGATVLVGGGGCAGGAAGVGGAGGTVGSGSLLSVSAGASTILAGSTASLERLDPPSATVNSRVSHRFPAKSKVAPAPPAVGAVGAVGAAGAGGAGGVMSDHLDARCTGRSGVAWPSAVIPARVKKLSWDDAQGEPEKEVNEATNSAVTEHMNLTVYF
ncbi:Protocadherin Fat 1 [Papilio machaon]|uniref:Protocadherin Fat 1 n=1 Tax=Papilio machaon TaxID=76193 RepID=A0A0N1IDZ5_PAPMA|nr:Protocadherin Fat 1 [Papilio machaon]